ncbi:hypothetical protein L3Q82_021541, partial [Scortum barcoo]
EKFSTMRPPVEVCVCLLSLLAPGVLYTLNNIPALQEPLPILGVGLVVLGFVLLLLLLTVRNKTKVDPLFYVFAGFSFTCMVGLTNALEQDRFMSGFMGFYIKMGEPHLSTAYAVMMSYWEGIFHFILFLTIIHRMFRGKQYRSLGLLWAGSSIAHQIVHIPGVVIGKYGSNIRPAFWRNIPFFVVPFWAASMLLSRPQEMPIIAADKVSFSRKDTNNTLYISRAEEKPAVWDTGRNREASRPVDLLLSLLSLVAMAFSVFRGLVVLECPLNCCFTYIYQYEPDWMTMAACLPQVEGLERAWHMEYGSWEVRPRVPGLTLGYGVEGEGCTADAGAFVLCSAPADVLHLWSEDSGMQHWMLDWTIFFAGAMAQSQTVVVPYWSISALPHSLHVPSPCRQVHYWWPVITLTFFMCCWMLDAAAPDPVVPIGALHSRTPFTYRVPADKWWPVITLNVLARCHARSAGPALPNPAYFMKPVPKGQTNKEKKEN